MPNPTSKLNLVINGTTTQLDIHDSNAVDLTSNQTVGGNKEFTGTTTAHDVIPSATETYNFGSPSYQWNNAYIKSLTINGVVCGDILTHNVSEFVNVSTAQTIGGDKTFTGNGFFNSYRVKIKNGSQEIGVVPSTNQWNGINFIDKNKSSTFSIEQAFLSNGNTVLHFSMTPNIAGGSLLRIFESTYNASTAEIVTKSRTLIPDVNNSRDLGTSTNKWKSFNGINPGALSLPSISASGANAWIALDTTDWVKNAATSAAQKYTPPADGWLNIRVDNAIMLGLAITGGSNNYMHQMVRSETPNSLALLIPVFKNIEVAILVAGNDNLTYNRATFYPCQGNV